MGNSGLKRMGRKMMRMKKMMKQKRMMMKRKKRMWGQISVVYIPSYLLSGLEDVSGL